jgi:large subunit ribosomal protein L28
MLSLSCRPAIAASARLAAVATTASPLLRFSPPSDLTTPRRAFSTTPPCATKTVKAHLLPSNLIPAYPYGERRLYKQSNRGLYGAARIRFGNRVAHKYKQKSKRYWKPNVHVKTFPLPSVGTRIKTRLTLRVLKTIRRENGLENYLLKNKPARVKDLGPGGWNLRWLLMQSRPVQERLNKERVALGLEPRPIVNNDDIIHYALDFATPGPLSMRSRGTIEGIKAGLVGDAFLLGNEPELVEAEDVEELSDEAEAKLLSEMADDQAAGIETVVTPELDRRPVL